MEQLNGKRLLVLGGNLWSNSIKKVANKYGITLISNGIDTNGNIFDIADEICGVDSIDEEAMLSLMKMKKIDGVYMGGSERVISAACRYVNLAGYSCYCSYKQWNMLQDKKHFKRLCLDNNLPVVTQYEITDDDIHAENFKVEYPLVTKPADGCGSSGFSVCHSAEEFIRGYTKAKESSPNGKVIVERFVKNDALCVLCSLSEGELHICGIEDKYPVYYEKQGSFVGGLYLLESSCSKEFKSRYISGLKSLCKSIGLKEGFIWFEVFWDGSSYYFNEAGFRTGGEGTMFPVDFLYNINQVASDMYYALTGKSKLYGFPSLVEGYKKKQKYYGIYAVHLVAGIISCIDGVDTLKSEDEIITVLTAKKIGDIVEDTGTFSQIFALVHFSFNNPGDLKKIVKHIIDTLIVKDEKGRNMVNSMLDIDTFDNLRTFN